MPTASRLAAPLLALTLLGGCISQQANPSWGIRAPDAADIGSAAASAARSPATWLPLAAAALLSIGDLDEDLSDWGADQAPLFGADAESDSDDLRRVAQGAWLITALAAPSRTLTDKAGGLAVGAGALLLERAVTDGIKELADRRRPDGSNERSFTSGHAGAASAAATLARANLDYLGLPGWLDGTLRVGLHGVALGSGWARVEARRHYVTDVLCGYAVGHFLAAFVQQSFMGSGPPGAVQVRYRPLPEGGAVTLVVSIR
ncbi:MAG TPA: phosphatase PAP2 family protein [Pseudomonadales bacterium]